MNLALHYLEQSMHIYKRQKAQAEGALAQLSDEQFFAAPSQQGNSAAVIVKHVAGNLRSRFSNFLSTDGEKQDRQREQEFDVSESRDLLMQQWQQGWQILFDSLEALTAEDVSKTVHIRMEPFTVLQALERSKDHTAHHVGQIVYLAKWLKGEDWQNLSIPKGQSEAFVPEALKTKWAKGGQ